MSMLGKVPAKVGAAAVATPHTGGITGPSCCGGCTCCPDTAGGDETIVHNDGTCFGQGGHTSTMFVNIGNPFGGVGYWSMFYGSGGLELNVVWGCDGAGDWNVAVYVFVGSGAPCTCYSGPVASVQCSPFRLVSPVVSCPCGTTCTFTFDMTE